MKIKYFCKDGGHHPVAGHVFYRQAEAVNGQEAARYNRYLCGVLGAVAQTIENCDLLLSGIESVERGQDEQIETGGNDVTITITKLGVHVDIEINEDWIGRPEGTFKLHEWKAALEGWRQFLTMPKAQSSILEVDL